MLVQRDVAHLERSLLNCDAPPNAAQKITINKKKIKKEKKRLQKETTRKKK